MSEEKTPIQILEDLEDNLLIEMRDLNIQMQYKVKALNDCKNTIKLLQEQEVKDTITQVVVSERAMKLLKEEPQSQTQKKDDRVPEKVEVTRINEQEEQILPEEPKEEPITKVENKKKYSVTERIEHAIAAVKHGNLKDYARKVDINYNSIYAWTKSYSKHIEAEIGPPEQEQGPTINEANDNTPEPDIKKEATQEDHKEPEKEEEPLELGDDEFLNKHKEDIRLIKIHRKRNKSDYEISSLIGINTLEIEEIMNRYEKHTKHQEV